MRLGAGTVSGDATFPVNQGRLCIKGFTAAATLAAPDRLTTPLVRGPNGKADYTWAKAIAARDPK